MVKKFIKWKSKLPPMSKEAQKASDKLDLARELNIKEGSLDSAEENLSPQNIKKALLFFSGLFVLSCFGILVGGGFGTLLSSIQILITCHVGLFALIAITLVVQKSWAKYRIFKIKEKFDKLKE